MKLVSKLSILMILALLGCQTETKVRETTKILPVARDHAVKIDEQTVILDARPFFQYSSSHLPQAFPIRWEDFSQAGNDIKGTLDPDAFARARTLARLGISPDTHVVVVGGGRQGHGEEGRVAWTLAYYGLKNVQFSKESYLKGKRLQGNSSPAKNISLWKPSLNSDLIVDEKQLMDAVKAMTQPGAHGDQVPVILDVRTPAEYLKKSEGVVDLGAMNMVWTQFIDEQGRPRQAIVKDLVGFGIGANRPIIAISSDGVQSAAVVMALHELGFTRVANFAPGYKGLSRKSLR